MRVDLSNMNGREPAVEPCEAKRTLLQKYDAATAAFAAAVSLLNEKIGTSSREEYEELRRAVDAARVKSEQGRLALEAHVAQHGC